MFLKKFALPKTDERLVTIDNTIFKIKIHLVKHPNRNEKSYEEFCSNPKHQEEIEKIMIVLLTSEDDPQPIRTNNLTVYPYRKKWEIAHILQFYRNKVPLKTCPYVHYFYIEPKLALPNKHHLKHKKQCENNTKQNTYQTDQRNKPEESPGTINEKNAQKRSAEKCIDKIPTIVKSTDQKQILDQPNNKQLAPNSTVGKEYDESESEDNESVSLLAGIHIGSENLSQEILSSSSGDESSVYSTARAQAVCSQTKKQDIKKESCKPIKLIRQPRKRHGELLEEVEKSIKTRYGGYADFPPLIPSLCGKAEPKRKNYSVTEYLDANRHDVEEQDLQELLRFQHLATPAEEKPAVEEESSIQRVFSSVKKLVFG